MVERRGGIPDTEHVLTPTAVPFREACYLFFDAVTPADVASSFSGVLDMKIDPTSTYYSDVQDFISYRVRIPPPQTTLHVGALTHELLQMQHPALWLKLFRKTRKRESGGAIDAKLKEAFPASVRQVPLLDIAAEKLATQNLRIFGQTVLELGLSAVYGPNFPKAIPESAKYARDGSIARRYEAVLEASKPFEAPASSAQEVVTRLQQLFPPNPISVPTSALNAIRGKRAFDGPVHLCPAPGLTRMLFDEYGKKLLQVPYQQRLVRSLQGGLRSR